MQVVVKAVQYVLRHPERIRPGCAGGAALPADPWYTSLRQAIDTAARAGDVAATKAACRAWWDYVLVPVGGTAEPALPPASAVEQPRRERVA